MSSLLGIVILGIIKFVSFYFILLSSFPIPVCCTLFSFARQLDLLSVKTGLAPGHQNHFSILSISLFFTLLLLCHALSGRHACRENIKTTFELN
jgi:hypothetical protein